MEAFESAAPWSANPADGVKLALRSDTGARGRALRLDFDFVKGGGYAVAHRALDGKCFPVDHPFWHTWFPPNGHRCRCGVDSLSTKQVEDRGLVVETELPGKIEVPGHGLVDPMPPPGWRSSPALRASVDAAGDRARRAMDASPLLRADPAGLVRDDAKRAAVIERFTAMPPAKVAAQLGETPVFAVESAIAVPGPEEAIVDWHTFTQNDEGAAQFVERLVEVPHLASIGRAVEVVPRVRFLSGFDPAKQSEPEVVWMDNITQGAIVGASPEVAMRMRIGRAQLAPLVSLIVDIGERRPGDPGASPVRGAWAPMSCVICAGESPPDLGEGWHEAWRLTRSTGAGRHLVELARSKREGWDAARVLVNASLWATLA